MLAKNHKEKDSAESKSSTAVTPEEEEATDDEQESLEMGAEPGTPITVGGDGSPL